MNIRFLTIGLSLTILACSEPKKPTLEEKQKAMIEQAKKDAAEERVFERDSLSRIKEFELDSIRLATSFTDDTVEKVQIVRESFEDDDGETQSFPRYIVWSKNRKICELDEPHFKAASLGKVINCQWTDKLPPVEQ